MKNKDLIVKLKGFKKFVLQRDFYFYFEFEDRQMQYIRVPKGFETDFGSVPQIFQCIISPIGKATKAYVLHDYLCFLHKQGVISREACDEFFKIALLQLKIEPIRILLLHKSVRLYAIFKGYK